MKEMWPQSTDGVFREVSSELLTGTAEQEDSDDAVGLPEPRGDFTTEHGAGTTAFVVSQAYPFRQ